jgi:hypothetical protein
MEASEFSEFLDYLRAKVDPATMNHGFLAMRMADGDLEVQAVVSADYVLPNLSIAPDCAWDIARLAGNAMLAFMRVAQMPDEQVDAAFTAVKGIFGGGEGRRPS